MVSFILPGNSASSDYEVANSLRFNDDSSDYLDKSSYATATSTKKFTWSCWFKLGEVGARGRFFDFWKGGGSGFSYGNGLFFTTGHELGIGSGDNSNGRIITTRKFRDPSAWYHVVAVYDSPNSTAGDRLQLYINGVRETDFSANVTVTQNWDYQAFTSNHGGIGTYYDKSTSSEFFDGYMAEVVFIDGQALDPTSFGEFDEDSGIWKPIDVSGLTFGNNGFYLDFEDSSALGNDKAGSNNFTVNNLTAIDQSTDTCTNNFATINPLDNFYGSGTFAEGNLKVTSPSGSSAFNTGTIGVSSGKWFWEVKYVSDSDSGANYSRIGITGRVATASNDALGNSNSMQYASINGAKGYNGGSNSYGSAYAPGDIIGVALDLDSGTQTITFYKNGSSQGAIDLALINGGTPTGFWFPAVDYDDGSHSGVFEANFGSPPYSESGGNSDGNGYGNFSMSVPSGYYALNTKNLAEYG